jgi:cytochrome b subunit of formate dehydrogenase
LSKGRRGVLRRAVHWSLAIVSLLVVLSGLGITQYRIVQAATFGILGKARAFDLHTVLWIPFLLLLGLHVALMYDARRPGHGRGGDTQESDSVDG